MASSASSCHLHTLPKDILLRAIASLLESDEILSTARSSFLLLQSFHSAELNRSTKMREYVRYRTEECRSILAALTSHEIETLKEIHRWRICRSATEKDWEATTTTGSDSSSSSLSSSSSSLLRITPYVAIGRVTSLRWRFGTGTFEEDPSFLQQHLPLLPRSIRSLSFIANNRNVYDFRRLCLPVHLTELHLSGAGSVAVGEIEKLQQLEVLRLDMDSLVRRDDNAAALSSPSTPTPRHKLPAFPASLHTLILSQFCLRDWEEVECSSSAALPSFVWPPTLTSLEFTSSVSIDRSFFTSNPKLTPQERLRYYDLFTRLPDTLTRWKFDAPDIHDMFLWLIQQNRLPMALHTIEHTHPLRFDVEPQVQWQVDPPRAVIRTMKFDNNSHKVNLLLVPLLNGTVGMCTIMSLTLPFSFCGHQQLRQFTSLTHLSNLNCDSLKEIVFPSSLERLEMGSTWLRSLTEESWQPPPALNSIYLGRCWAMPWISLRLPATIRHIRLGFDFHRPPPSSEYAWPPLLESLTLTSNKTASSWSAYASAVPAGCRIFVPSHVSTSGVVIGSRLAEWSEGHECAHVVI